jgi:hypothetical protein
VCGFRGWAHNPPVTWFGGLAIASPGDASIERSDDGVSIRAGGINLKVFGEVVMKAPRFYANPISGFISYKISGAE